MSGCWCLYDMAHPQRRRIRRFPAAATAEALKALVDRDHRRRFVRLYDELTGRELERKGGVWRDLAPADDGAAQRALVRRMTGESE